MSALTQSPEQRAPSELALLMAAHLREHFMVGFLPHRSNGISWRDAAVEDIARVIDSERAFNSLRMNSAFERGLCEDFETLLPKHPHHQDSTGGWIMRLEYVNECAEAMAKGIEVHLARHEGNPFVPLELTKPLDQWRAARPKALTSHDLPSAS